MLNVVTTSTPSYSMSNVVTTSTSSYSIPNVVTTNISPTPSSSLFLVSTSVVPVWCPCSCEKYWLIRNLTSTNKTTEQVEQEVEQSLKEMTVEKTETTAAQRKLVSVEDKRTSARVVGTVGMAFFIAVFAFLVLSDLPILVRIIRRVIRNVRSHRKQLTPQETRRLSDIRDMPSVSS